LAKKYQTWWREGKTLDLLPMWRKLGISNELGNIFIKVRMARHNLLPIDEAFYYPRTSHWFPSSHSISAKSKKWMWSNQPHGPE
jgi:hypothetical protein